MRERYKSVRQAIALIVLSLCIGLAPPILGVEEEPETDKPPVEIEEKSSSTQGRVTIAGQPVEYTVTV